VAVVSGAAEPTAVAGGKDCLRSAAPLVGQPQQSPTANSETFTSPRCCRTSRRLLLFNVVNEKSLADYNFAPFRGAARHECRDPQFELRAQAKPPEGSSEEWKDAMRQEDWLMAKKVIIWIVLWIVKMILERILD
jgi:hypothetical protein